MAKATGDARITIECDGVTIDLGMGSLSIDAEDGRESEHVDFAFSGLSGVSSTYSGKCNPEIFELFDLVDQLVWGHQLN